MNRYFKNALLLTGSGLALRALGMMFRVVLAAKLGSQGMGVYQLVLTLYNVSVSLATAGLSVAAAGLTARLINQETNPTGAVGRITLFGLGLGSLAGYGVFLYAKAENMMNITVYHYPAFPAVVLAVAVAALQMILTYAVSRNFRRMSLIDRIRYSE